MKHVACVFTGFSDTEWQVQVWDGNSARWGGRGLGEFAGGYGFEVCGSGKFSQNSSGAERV